MTPDTVAVPIRELEALRDAEWDSTVGSPFDLAVQALIAHITPTAPATGCTCGHTATWHRSYRDCAHPGCTCWAYRKTTNRNAPAAAGTGSGA